MVRTAVFVIASVLAAREASAEVAELVEARAALSAVQYDRARGLLVEALKRGTASPAELAEIYRLSASTATVLGDREVAEQYYRRWLALEPSATLPSSVAPKLREPFVAAQAHMAAHGRLSIKGQRHGDDVVIVVESDPLAMAARVAVVGDAPVGFDAEHRAKLAAPASAPALRIAVLDEFGNTLVELSEDDLANVVEAPAVPPPRTRPSRLRHPVVWGVATVVVGGTAVGFGLAARGADDELTDILANSRDYTLADAEDARDRRDRYALVANIGFVGAGALAVTTAILVVTRPETTVVPTASASGVGVAAVATW